MQLRTLLADEDRAVSPVIGVILMVAITVILAAVVGTFVMGLADQFQQSPPNANFQFDYEDGTLEVAHSGGEGIEADELFLRGDVSGGSWADAGHSGEVKAGDSVNVCDSGCDYTWSNGPEDATVRVVWDDADSDRSSTLRTWER